MKFIKEGEDLIADFHGDIPKELEEHHCFLLQIKGAAFSNKGYLSRSLESTKVYLAVAEKYGIRKYVGLALGSFGTYYWNIGDLDKALEYLDRGMKIIEESITIKDITSMVFLINYCQNAMEISIEKGYIELARSYFKRLEGHYESSIKDKLLQNQYNYTKVRFLQASLRARDRAKAEDLYKEIIESKTVFSTHKIKALIGLCNLLLVELRITSDIEVLMEIKPVLDKLIDLAQQQKSDLYLTISYILKGKLALLTFDIKTARRVLIQAQRISERRGFKLRAAEIGRLHDDLKGKLDNWKQLEKTNAPLSERIKLAGLDGNFEGHFRTKIMKMERDTENIDEKEVTVYKDMQSCLVCKGGVEGFNMFICPKCKSIYCRTCAEAVVEIENACWTCENPIDVARPSKPFEQEEEEITVGEKSDKKAPKGEPKKS